MSDLLQQLFSPSGIHFYPLLIGLLGSISFGIIFTSHFALQVVITTFGQKRSYQ